MYVSVAGNTYFSFDDVSDRTQIWRIWKVEDGTDDMVRDGDTVMFENVYYDGNYLQRNEDDPEYVASDYGHDYWIIRLAD